MGNQTNFQTIRTATIEQRNKSLLKYKPIFFQILRSSTLNLEQVEEITRKNITQIVDMLNNSKITSQQLLAIFAIRAIQIGKKNCIITEDMFQSALILTQQCDSLRKNSGKRNWTLNDEWDLQKYLPPLFGVPISIKENIPIKGTRSTVGLSARANRIDQQDAGLITCLKNSGAIPFIKTNLPQIALCFDSTNHLWGRTLNPWNKKKSAGGSSGGEGSAVASRVSVLGVGNDMLGSIRIPAAFNGVFGILPTPQRISNMGKYSTGFSGMDTVGVVNGPISTSVDSLALFLKTATTQSFYKGSNDPYVKLHSFDSKVYNQTFESKKKLRIGFIQTLKLIQPTTSVKRALKEVMSFLQKEGHTLVAMQIPRQQQVLTAPFKQLVSQGDMASFEDMLQGQQIIQQYKKLNFLSKRSTCVFACITSLVRKLYPRLGIALQASKKLSVHQYLEHVGRVKECRTQWIKQWKKNNIDFLICPTFATQAANHGSSGDGSFLAAYCYIFNVLAMTTCTQPITVVRQDELTYQSEWDDDVTRLIKQNLKDAVGMPLSIQVVGLPFEEQKVLGFSKKIEKHFKFYQKHPLPQASMNKVD